MFHMTSYSINTSLVVLPAPQTWEFRCYHAYKLRYTLFRMHFRFMAAILDSPLILTTPGSIRTSPVVLHDPENMGKAVGISLLTGIQLRYASLRVNFRFVVAIFDFSLTQTSDGSQTCCTVLLELRNAKMALGWFCCPACNNAEI